MVAPNPPTPKTLLSTAKHTSACCLLTGHRSPCWLANIVFFGFGEEVGWRGFALPHLLKVRRRALVATLILSLFCLDQG